MLPLVHSRPRRGEGEWGPCRKVSPGLEFLTIVPRVHCHHRERDGGLLFLLRRLLDARGHKSARLTQQGQRPPRVASGCPVTLDLPRTAGHGALLVWG